MRVIVADDSLIVRKGLVRLLEVGGHEVVAEASRPEVVPALVAAHHPRVVLVDIKMPPTFTDEGLRLAALVRRNHPAVAVLVLSNYVVASYVSWLLHEAPAGVGYLLKDHLLDVAVLEGALQRVAGDGTYVDPLVVDHLLASKHDTLDPLSPRERDVLRLMAEGLSDQGIAQRMNVSLNTVGSHVKHVFTKLDLPQSHSDNRRVRAVLQYLAAAEG